MLLFAAPLYFVLYIIWLIYAGLIKKNIRQHMPVIYIGGIFALIWGAIIVLNFI